ncbi:taste receptor type 2 member 40-like [Mantella aurantiaca]
MRQISEDFLHNSNFRFINVSAVTGRVLSSLSGAHTPNLSMLSPQSFSVLISAVLGFVLVIPSNTCIVVVYLESLRKKEKLSPSDVIFLAKGIVNIPLQCFLSLQGMFFIFPSPVSYDEGLYSFIRSVFYFLTYYSFWLTAWLSAHYCTSITNLSCGLFTGIKKMMSDFLGEVLLMTALGILPLSVLVTWTFSSGSPIHSAMNNTESTIVNSIYDVNYSYFAPVTFLGCILPFCLSLLCLVLTFSFLVRHVWRVKNNDSGSNRPNLQAHVTALRTIFFLLLMFTFFFMSQVILFRGKSSRFADITDMVSWIFRLLSPSAEVAVIFKASNKLKNLMRRRFETRSWRSTET